LETRNVRGKEVVLPRFMMTLSQDTIDEMSSEDMIISCGIDDEVLYMVTSNLDVRHIKPTGKLRPTRCFPSSDGLSIVTYFEGMKNPSLILSTIAIKNSESSLTNTSLFVNNSYMCDLEIDGSEYDDTTPAEETDQRRS